ncbi:TonB-dependent receptor [Limibacter armeniacum]|uniref:TonB-dependent receptor n=1 Tax=Limibacter armeniacum TaxID=466084 RepID=UPI002FE542ED
MKFWRRLFSWIILFSISASLQAQKKECTYNMQGKILDAETKEPIPYVTVKVKDSNQYTLTDLEGNFVLKELCEQQQTLIISCFGYCDSICEQNHQHGKSPHIYLRQEVRELDGVVITASPVETTGTASLAQATLGRGVIDQDLTQSLAAAISEEAGVTFTSTGPNVALPVIHGLYGNRILVLNNGLKHGFQNWGTDHAPEISLAAANNVTVLKGAAGVRFGPEALGGALLVESAPLYLNEPFELEATTGFQSNGRGILTSLKTGKGGEKWSYQVGGSYTRIGDRHAPDYSLTNSGKEELSLQGGLRYRHKDWSAKLYYSFVDQNLALLCSSIADSGDAFANAINSDEPLYIFPFSYDINEPNQLTVHHLGKAEIDWHYAENGKLTFRTGLQLNKRQEFDVRRNANSPIIDLDLLTADYQLEWKHPDWARLDGLVGLQLFTQNNDNNPGTGTTPFVPNYNSTRYSGFIIERLRKEQNTFEVGLRLDYEHNNVRGRETNQDIFRDDYEFTNLTASLGYIRELSESSTFRTNFGTAWRTPNMAELYSFGQHGFKSSFGLLRYGVENGRLTTDEVTKLNESNIEAERGFKWINEWQTQQQDHSLTLTAYSHYIQNFIYDRPVTVTGSVRGPMPVFIFEQADALFLGTDFTWQQQWSPSLQGRYSLSYLWFRNIEDDEVLINQPPLTTAYKLEWTTPDFWEIRQSTLTVKPSYTFRQFQAPRTVSPDQIIDGSVTITPDSEIFDFRDAPDGYFLLDISWGFKVGDFAANIAVQNLLNTRYRNYLNEMRYFADEPGRNFLLTVRYLLQ